MILWQFCGGSRSSHVHAGAFSCVRVRGPRAARNLVGTPCWGATVFMYSPCKMALAAQAELSTDPVSEESPGCALYAANVLHSNEAATKLARTHAALLWAKTLDRKTIIDGGETKNDDLHEVETTTVGGDETHHVKCLVPYISDISEAFELEDLGVLIRTNECYKVEDTHVTMVRLDAIGYDQDPEGNPRTQDIQEIIDNINAVGKPINERMIELQNRLLIRKIAENEATGPFYQLSAYYIMRLISEGTIPLGRLRELFYGFLVYRVEPPENSRDQDGVEY